MVTGQDITGIQVIHKDIIILLIILLILMEIIIEMDIQEVIQQDILAINQIIFPVRFINFLFFNILRKGGGKWIN